MGLTINRQPNRYGGCCGGPKPMKRITNRHPSPPPCDEPESIEQCDGTFKTPCHCYYDRFLALFPEFECKGESQICAQLEVAEACTAGFMRAETKAMATMNLAAHRFAVQAIAITEAASRTVAASKGSQLARPSGPGNAPEGYAYYELSVYGLAYWELSSNIPHTGMIVVG